MTTIAISMKMLDFCWLTNATIFPCLSMPFLVGEYQFGLPVLLRGLLPLAGAVTLGLVTLGSVMLGNVMFGSVRLCGNVMLGIVMLGRVTFAGGT